MKNSIGRTAVGLAVAALVMAASPLGSSAFAAAIAFGAATTISGDSDVSVTGTLDRAYNFAGSARTINGVTFAQVTTQPFGTANV